MQQQYTDRNVNEEPELGTLLPEIGSKNGALSIQEMQITSQKARPYAQCLGAISDER